MLLVLLYLINFFISHPETNTQVPCEIAYEREIVNTNSKRVDLVPHYFFAFSHPELKSFYKSNNFIKAYCQVSKNNGLVMLNLNIHLASSVAKSEYGIIGKDSNLNIHLIKGGVLNLKCTNGSMGRANDKANNTIYALTYELDKSEVKKLKKYDIDEVEIEWSSGFEKYEVYEVDAVLNQMNCMEKLGLL